MEDYSKYFENLVSDNKIEEIENLKKLNNFYRYELDSKNKLIKDYEVSMSVLENKNIKLEASNRTLRLFKYFAIFYIIITILRTIIDVIM